MRAMQSYSYYFVIVALMGAILATACIGTSATEVPVPVPTDAPTPEELCSADREPGFPCITGEGAALFHGECCVDSTGHLGTCMRTAPDGGDVTLPWCNSRL